MAHLVNCAYCSGCGGTHVDSFVEPVGSVVFVVRVVIWMHNLRRGSNCVGGVGGGAGAPALVISLAVFGRVGRIGQVAGYVGRVCIAGRVDIAALTALCCDGTAHFPAAGINSEKEKWRERVERVSKREREREGERGRGRKREIDTHTHTHRERERERERAIERERKIVRKRERAR